MALLDTLTATLLNVGFTVVESTVGTNRIILLGRCPTSRANSWKVVRHALKVAEARASSTWKVDISKMDLLSNKTSGSLVWAWRVILQAADIEGGLRETVEVIRNATPAASRDVMEVTLPGGGRHRQYSSRPGARGARPTGGSADYYPTRTR